MNRVISISEEDFNLIIDALWELLYSVSREERDEVENVIHRIQGDCD